MITFSTTTISVYRRLLQGDWPTYCVSFTEASGDHIVHVAVFAELQLRQVHLHLAVFHKHTLFHHLEKTSTRGYY